MRMAELSCQQFVEELASKKAVPGGGGAAGLLGAVGTALASMVANLTVNKKKYAEYQADMEEALDQAQKLQQRFLEMIDEDAENFKPLASAYHLPSNTPSEQAYKATVLEEATRQALITPIALVKTVFEAIQLHADLVDKGSVLALSDVGVGIVTLRAALLSGWLNVKINTQSLKDRTFAESVETELKTIVDEGTKRCDQIYQQVESKL